MAKHWAGSLEEKELIREINKHPIGTPPIEIFYLFDARTWAALKSANRIGGATKEWSVYRRICKMLRQFMDSHKK